MSLRYPLFARLREIADVIALDQRGVGRSTPSLDFKESWNFPLDRPANREEMTDLARKHAAACAKFFADQGIDLSAYNTNENADDVDDLRRALGADKIGICGSSYGTHLGFAVIRRHGEHIHRAILSGIEGPDDTLKLPSEIEQALRNVDLLCKNDPEIKAAVPDLLALVKQLLDRLEREPVTVEIEARPGEGKTKVVVGKLDLQIFVSEAVGRVRTIQGLPAGLVKMSRGDFSELARAAYRFRKDGVGSGMSLMMDCASGASPERLRRIQEEAGRTLLGDAINFPFLDLCPGCGSPDLGSEFRSPVHSDVPVLFISGLLDGRTPPANAEAAALGFPNGRLLLVENVGHEETLFSLVPEMRDVMLAFLKGTPPTKDKIAVAPPHLRRP